MIKFLGERNGRPMLGLGLSKENCRKLLDGNPIFIDLKVMMMDMPHPPDMSDGTVLIFGGKDEQAMQRDLQKYGRNLPKAKPHYEEN